MTTALEQLRYIDEQLAGAALPQDQAELVRVHRLTGLQLRTERMQGRQLIALSLSYRSFVSETLNFYGA